MGKFIKKFSYKYILIIIILSFLVIGKTGIMSQLVLFDLRNEVMPLAMLNFLQEPDIMEEVFPIYGTADYNFWNVQTDDNTTVNTNINKEVTSASINTEIPLNEQSSSEEIVVDNSNDLDNSTYEGCDSELESTEYEETVPVNSIVDNSGIGITYSMEQLMDFEFLVNNCYIVDGSTSVTREELDAEALLGMDLSIDCSGDDYKVLIYHSHGSEAFVDSRPGMTEDTIIGVGDELTRILEEDYGIKTFHDRTVYDVVDGKLDRNYAYTQSGKGIDKILEQYPSIEVILDIHRDGVRDDVRLVKTIDGKPTAQIMFFNGVSRLNDEGDLGYLHNPNIMSNLGFSLKMYINGQAMYGDLMRRIYIGGYCYNLDRRPRASLIEVGAQTNTVEEVKNAMTPLAAIIYSVLTEK